MSRVFSAFLLAVCLATGARAQETSEPLYVKLQTSMGDIYLELFPDKAPKTVENFLNYVNDDFYDGTIFHRVIPTFVIQGGGFTEDFTKKPTGEPIQNEADNMVSNERGTIAMARTGAPHSATSQFFINVADNQALNHTGKTHSRAWGYAVFGRVIDGMEVVDAIRSVPTGAGGQFRSDVPQTPIVIETVEVVDSLPTQPEEPETAPEPEPQAEES